MTNLREQALVLLKQFSHPTFLAKESLARQGETLSHRDRAFLQELVYGCIRWHYTLSHLVSKFCSVSPTSEEYWLLQLGFYQLLLMNQIPPYAAVYETVALKSSVKGRRFLNGVLRAFQRSLEIDPLALTPENSLLRRPEDSPIGFKKPFFAHPNPLQQLAWRSSHPRWILEAYQKVMSESEQRQVLAWNNATPPNTIRINTLKIEPELLKKRLVEAGISFQDAPHPRALHLEISENIFAQPLFQEGHFTLQDTWSMSVVEALQIAPGDRVLDACAAPGGKTSFIAEQLKHTGEVVALDPNALRLKKIHENIQRLGLSQVIIQHGHAESSPFEKPFDKILLDVPCSNSGAWARRVEARYRQHPKHLSELVALQQKILSHTSQYLKPSGRLVYSTCSLFYEENQGQIQDFLKTRPSFRLEQEQLSLPGNPHFSGGYVAVLTLISGK